MRGATFALIVAVVAFLLVLRFGASLLPSVRSTPEEACSRSPTPSLCRAMMTGGPLADLAGLRDLADPMPLDMGGAPLVAGVDALEKGWPVVALRLCSDAAKVAGPDQAAALLCASRAAARMGWPMRSIYFAQRVLDGTPFPADEGAAWLLIGDGHRVQKNCREAKTAYLRALSAAPDLDEARRGLEACGATAPPMPDLTGKSDDLDEEGGADAVLS